MNLLTRMWRRQPDEISRYTTADYIRQLTQGMFGLNPFVYAGSTTYSKGRPSERVENSYTGYVYGAYKINPIVYGLMTRRSSVFSEARFMWRQVTDGKPGDLFWTEELRVLERPWPNGSTGELLVRMIQDADLAGNSYISRDGNRLRWHRPDWQQIVLSGDPLTQPDVDVVGYTYTPGGPDNGESVPYLPDEMCHWSPIPDPAAMYRGMSWLTPVVREILADQAATQHKLNFFQNGATLGPIFRLPKEMTKEQFEKFKAIADAGHQGTENAYKPMYVGGGADVTLSAATLQQLDFRSTQGAGETRLCVAAGVPAPIAGVSEGLAGSSLNAGNFGVARRLFADGTIRPLLRSVCTALSTIVAVPDGAELWFDESEIEFFREDQQDAAQIAQTQMATIVSGVTGGFKPETVVIAVAPQWKDILEPSGFTSVQLQPVPDGSTPPADTSSTDTGAAVPALPPDPYASDQTRASFDLDDITRADSDSDVDPDEPVVAHGLYVGRDEHGDVQVRWVGDADVDDPDSFDGADLSPEEFADLADAFTAMAETTQDAESTRALLDLIDEAILRAAYDDEDELERRDVSGELRVGTGHSTGGQWTSQIVAAIAKWIREGEHGDPFVREDGRPFSPATVKKAAEAHGLHFPPRTPQTVIKVALRDKLRADVHEGRMPEPAKVAKKATPRVKALTPEAEKAAIRDYVHGGMSVRDVAQKHGVSAPTIHKLLTTEGVQLRPRGGSSAPRKAAKAVPDLSALGSALNLGSDEEIAAKARRDLAAGRSQTQVAKEIEGIAQHVSDSTSVRHGRWTDQSLMPRSAKDEQLHAEGMARVARLRQLAAEVRAYRRPTPAKAVPTPAAPTGRLDVHKIAREQGLDLPAEHLARIQRMLDGEEAVPRASGSPQKNASPAVVGRYLEQWANARHYSAATASSAAAEFRGHGRNDQLSAEAKAAGREGDQLLALGKHLQGLRHAGTRGVAAPGSDAEVHQARTIAELRALAKARGITVPSGLKKDQIREHILSGGTGGAAGPKKLRPGQLIGMDEHALAQAADEGRVSRPEAARRIRDMARQAAATNVFLNGSNETRTSIGEPIAQDILDQRQRDYAQGEQRVAELRALADQVEARPTKATPAQHRGLPQLVAPHGQLPYTDAELRSVQHIAPQFQAEQVARNRAHTIADLLAHTEALRESGASPQAMESRIRSHGKDLTPELVDRLVQVHTPAELDRLASQYGLHRTTPNVGGVEPYNPALHERLPGSPEIPRGTPVQIVRPGYDATVNGQRVQAVKAAVILHEPTETQHLAPAEVQTRIATVYQRLRAAGSSDWVSLTDLRRQPELRNLSSADVDAALKQLAHDPGFHMSPQENQKLLTAADRAAALQMGDRAYHFLHIEPGRGSVAPAAPAPFDPRDVAERITTERGSADQIRAELRGLNSVQLRHVAKELNLTQAIGNLKGRSGDALLEWMVQTILKDRDRFQWRSHIPDEDDIERSDVDEGEDDPKGDAAAGGDIERRFNPREPRLPKGGPGGGRWTILGALIRAGSQRGPNTAEIRDALNSGTASQSEIHGGLVAYTHHVFTRDGTDLIFKHHGVPPGVASKDPQHATRWAANAVKRANAEYLSSLVGQAVGAPVPTVVRHNDTDVYMGFVAGSAPPKTDLLGMPRSSLAHLAETDDGILLGLLDHLIANQDRNPGNWLVSHDGTRLTGIDHGEAFSRSNDVDPVLPPSVAKRIFMNHYVDANGEWADNDLSPHDVAIMRQRLQALRPEFAAQPTTQYASPLDWYDEMMGRFEEIAKHATGTHDRLTG